MRAEALPSQHRQKSWVAMATFLEARDLISHADGELPRPAFLVLSRAAG